MVILQIGSRGIARFQDLFAMRATFVRTKVHRLFNEGTHATTAAVATLVNALHCHFPVGAER